MKLKYKIATWVILCGLVVSGLIIEIRIQCKKVGQDECKEKKKNIIGLSLILLGLFIIIPGFSWAPLIYVWSKYGKKEGIKVLVGMILLTITLLVSGAILYFT